MRYIEIILTNKIDQIHMKDIIEDKIELQKYYGMGNEIDNEIYRFDEKKSNDKELKNIVIKINKSKNSIVYFITNKKDLFEFFNRDIICKHIEYKEDYGFNSNKSGYIHKNGYQLNLDIRTTNQGYSKNEYHLNLDIKRINEWYIYKILLNNIEEVLDKYGNIFSIDVNKLVKGTTYKVNNKEELKDLLYEDLQLVKSNQIITSRLAVVFYRLTYFDFDISKVFIGKYFSNYFGKSESFNINLNRNPNGYFFTDLNNKIFRGYRIKPIIFTKPDSHLNLKIKFAKRLLSKKVNKNIVAESLELSIEDIDFYIYNIQNKYEKQQNNKKQQNNEKSYSPYMRPGNVWDNDNNGAIC